MSNRDSTDRRLLSGNEAVALAALHAKVALGTGYPGTPSTEILENFSDLGGRAQWAPNEKVALEVGLGAAFAGARALVTMKHVGLNVAADPLFTAAYTGVSGALVIVVADDPGMASSQNEQDSRFFSRASGTPTIEPSDSQEAYDYLFWALEISQRWKIPVMLRLTTRICHSKTVVHPQTGLEDPPSPKFVRDIPGRVMIPAYARSAHRRLRDKLNEIAAWAETCDLNARIKGDRSLGIISSGVSYAHAREAAPDATFLKLGLTWPLPVSAIQMIASDVERCVAIEEGEPLLAESARSAGANVESKPDMYRFGELTVQRVRRILDGDRSPEPAPPKGKPPALCKACPYRPAFGALTKMGCVIAGDIGCYTLGVLPPLEAMDTCVCMGASIGVGLGLRHALPPDEAKKVVSVIGDSTFMHSGLTGLAEMVYNPPPTGHVVVVLDNSTTAMTGRQEHPGTGRSLDHGPAKQIVMEDVARAMGIERTHVIDPVADAAGFEETLRDSLESGDLAFIVARRTCILAAGKIREYERSNAESCQEAAFNAD